MTLFCGSTSTYSSHVAAGTDQSRCSPSCRTRFCHSVRLNRRGGVFHDDGNANVSPSISGSAHELVKMNVGSSADVRVYSSTVPSCRSEQHAATCCQNARCNCQLRMKSRWMVT